MNRNVVTVIAIVLIALGAFGLARGKFSYTEEKHSAEIAGVGCTLVSLAASASPSNGPSTRSSSALGSKAHWNPRCTPV